MPTKTAPQKACCSCCPPEKLLPWLLSILVTILITASAIYAYQAYLSRKPQVWVEPPFTSEPTVPLSDTSAWKTYRSGQFGVEFKYQSNLEVSSNNEGVFLSLKDNNYPDNLPLISFQANSLTEENFKKQLQEENSIPESGLNIKITTRTVKVDGKSFNLYLVDGYSGMGVYAYDYLYIIHPDSNYRFTIKFARTDEFNLDQILSTFKFLN